MEVDEKPEGCTCRWAYWRQLKAPLEQGKWVLTFPDNDCPVHKDTNK